MDSTSITAAITAHFERIKKEPVGAAQPMEIEDGSQKSREDGGDNGGDAVVQEQDGDAANAVQPMAVEEQPDRYLLEEKFHKDDLYWKDDVRASRFGSTFVNGIIYRPQIVADLHKLVDCALSLKVAQGIMVKGPGGVGKSHSLVNLVRKLTYESNGKYLVTFIPDCHKWQSVIELLEAICASCGIAVDPILNQLFKGNNVWDQNYSAT